MKICPRCKELKPTSDFGTNKSRKDGLQTHCKVCRRAVNHEYYLRSAHEQNPKRYARRAKIQAQNQQTIFDYLQTHPCVDCGFSDWRALQFDHVGDDKLFDIGSMLSVVSTETLLREIEKCQVRCANCHQIITAERAGSYRARLYSSVGRATAS